MEKFFNFTVSVLYAERFLIHYLVFYSNPLLNISHEEIFL